MSLRDSLVGRTLRGAAGTTYFLRECIGEGGQGWVFRASWGDPSGHVVIVKVLRPDVMTTEALGRFEREASVLRRLSTQARPSPYIVRFFDHAVAQVPAPRTGDPLALPFTVLEYVDGPTLARALAVQRESGRGMLAERVRRLLRQMCQALDFVHAESVIHRDLKPSNILLAHDAGVEVAKITDFGLVKAIDVDLVRTATLAGASLGYAPPEQYEKGNQRVSPRTDVFSLGAVAYEMLTTEPAFPFSDAENPLLVVTRILSGPRPTLRGAGHRLAAELRAAPELVDALDRELTRALAPNPGVRHASAGELWSALEPPLRGAVERMRTAPQGHAMVGHPASVGLSRAAPEAIVAGPSGRLAPATSGHSQPDELRAAEREAWSWSVVTQAPPGAELHVALFTATGDGAIAIGAAGLVRWERGVWIPVSLPERVPSATLRGLRWMGDGSVLLFGARGLVARYVPGGTTTLWRVPDPEITFLDALVEPDGTTTLVGERPSRGGAPRARASATAGVVTQFRGERLSVVAEVTGCARLRGVARLESGALVACGDAGAIVRVELGVAEFVASTCGGHLFAIAPLPGGGAVTVGAGGHALSLGPNLDFELEVVETTQNLVSLAVSESGAAWAGSVRGRLLRRSSTSSEAGRWLRMNHSESLTSTMLAVTVEPRFVRAVAQDGTVVEGRVA